MCRRGNIPAHMTAKIVIASANRLIEVRHFWCSRRRIAEISVPAWPIPIHQTKLTMANPNALDQEHGYDHVQDHEHGKCDQKTNYPTRSRAASEHDGTDLLSYGLE